MLLSILPGIAEVREVVLGLNGTLQELRPGTVHIEMSTIDVEEEAEARDRVQEAGGDLLDAPISGSPSMVGPRMATTFASGAPESIDAVTDVLTAISGPWVKAGAFGQGAHFTYIANLLLAVHTVAAAEAFALARRCGLDLELVQRTIDESIGGSMVFRRFGPRMRAREGEPPRAHRDPARDHRPDRRARAPLRCPHPDVRRGPAGVRPTGARCGCRARPPRCRTPAPSSGGSG
ncbi:NAD-binding of NADP-dependent 3-hydroxyisobutyrate dehydrogenase [Pseudonocardia thermophila]|uniref:NAD-binding of NADP-dependent 3-hydroxyisobutyrate dehydrogenase n=1 Tax=Pseudonocardia thermophila TaxID=1848 RepID=A0A1M6XYF9_PSETH|nr:NAD(P)-binding domain-containing protein [Pseudonocardia thermophila]SHL11041.1 NAD-binding of NADP-dependent 3-hydroxyisobutyrate dehydrogenase [Pseudonocardia thermophila]